MYRHAYRQLHAVLFAEHHQCLHCVIALRQPVIVLMADEGLAELSVMAVGREHRGLVVPQMAQSVG